MRFSIFRDAKDHDEKCDRHRMIHFVWKTKIFYPLMEFLHKHVSRFMVNKIDDIPKRKSKKRYRTVKWIWKLRIPILMIWLLNKHIKKFKVKSIDEIPNEAYNRNFRILYFSFEKGLEDWYYNFYGGIRNGKIIKEKYEELKEGWKNREVQHWYRFPKFFLNLLVTICLEDTAYRELVNCMLLRLQGEMNRNWNPKIKHKFPLYISMYESFMPFFIEWVRVSGGGKIMLQVTADKPKTKWKNNKKAPIYLRKEVADKVNKLDKKMGRRFYREMNELINRIVK